MLTAFGSTFAGDLGAPEPVAGWLAPGGAADVTLEPASGVEDAWSGPCDPPRTGLRRVDGRAVHVERGRAGDVRLEWAGAGSFWIAPAGDRVLCVAPGDRGPAWIRFVLDTVLSTVALVRGAVPLHAGCVAVGGRAVAVTAGQGGGKTSLLAELLSRGGALVADDVSVVAADLRVHPGPPVMNVALDRPFPPAADELGQVLAVLDGEAWVTVPVVEAPAPLAAVVRLDRTAAAECLGVTVLAPSPLPLLAAALHPGIDPAAQERMFTRLSDVAASVPILHLRAPLTATPGALADTLTAAIGNHGAA
jgi:hypothetical protein